MCSVASRIAYVYMYNINIITRKGVCVCVTDVTSLPQRVLWERGYNVYHHAYAGNESPNCCRHAVVDIGQL